MITTKIKESQGYVPRNQGRAMHRWGVMGPRKDSQLSCSAMPPRQNTAECPSWEILTIAMVAKNEKKGQNKVRMRFRVM